jgi:predicted Fe-Mo cluster-binding NifX family protein
LHVDLGRESIAMKIAIPTFGTRVSPRFDCAQAVLIVNVEEGESAEHEELMASGWAPHERINKLLELGVDTIVCGGIDAWSAESLQSAGVTIYGWVAGEIDDVLAALLRGELDSEAVMGAGGRWGCRRFPGDDGIRSPSPGSGRGMGRRGRRGSGPRGGRKGGRPGHLPGS